MRVLIVQIKLKCPSKVTLLGRVPIEKPTGTLSCTEATERSPTNVEDGGT